MYDTISNFLGVFPQEFQFIVPVIVSVLLLLVFYILFIKVWGL